MRIIIEEAGVEYRVATDKPIRTPQQASDACEELRGMEQEAFTVLCLNAKNGLKVSEVVTLGLLNTVLVHPREIFRKAIAAGAAAIVLAHNHPSGDTTPSAEDIRITRQLIDAGKIVGIPVLDHVIIGRKDGEGRGGWCSMRESGVISFV